MTFQKKYRAIPIVALILALCAVSSKAQVSPMQGLGQVQFFANDGTPLINGVLYSYQAGTSTQQATYTDSTGNTQNPNPIPFGSGARVQVWLTTANLYKFVLCLQNDGAFCAAGDILYSVDNVPGGTTSGSSGGSPFTGIFISGTASPATSGALRFSSGDSHCWRNQAGSANLCWAKDTNDLLSWAGGSFKLPEVVPPSGVLGFDILWADNTAHRLKAINNAGSAAQYVLSGNDIGTTDQVSGVHFGATQETFGAVAPTLNQVLGWNGSNIVGTGTTPNSSFPTSPAIVYTTLQNGTATFSTANMITPATVGDWRFSGHVHVTTAGTGCTTNTAVAITLSFTDPAGGGLVSETIPVVLNGSIVGTWSLINNSAVGAFQHLLGTTFRNATGTAIGYAVTITPGANCAPVPRVEIAPVLEQITAN